MLLDIGTTFIFASCLEAVQDTVRHFDGCVLHQNRLKVGGQPTYHTSQLEARNWGDNFQIFDPPDPFYKISEFLMCLTIIAANISSFECACLVFYEYLIELTASMRYLSPFSDPRLASFLFFNREC